MIKKISFFGFKSFADRVEVDFSDGITGVIGPNGCGKSNIVDGISFVLGAQSPKNLRGGKMEDLIFAGSDKRKPRDFAEVTLTLDNRLGLFKKVEEDSVAVTRRVFRKGGSEYLINDEIVRLRDIHDLFLDTGIGSDSYSIIGQGQIGKILSTKIDERRAIFEEASGIVKLKQQKEQTEKRLNEVDTNLVRIEDIVNEIEKQLKPLQKQSEKAKEYNEISFKLEQLETQYLLHEYDKIDEIIKETNEVIEVFVSEIESLTSNLDEQETKLSSSKATYQEENNEIFTLQDELAIVKEELEKTNGFVNLNNERIQNSKRQISEIDGNLKEIEDKYSLSTVDFKTKQDRLDEIVQLINELSEKLSHLNEKISFLESEKMIVSNDLEFNRKKSTEDYNELNKKKLEFEQLLEKERNLTTSLSAVEEKQDEVSQQKYDLEAKIERITTDYQTYKNDFDKKQLEYSSKQELLKEKKNELEATTDTLRNTETEWFREKNRMENLENFIENNEGFFGGVKAILNAKKDGKFDGVYGAVVELIKVNKRYETAMDELLQSASQNLITTNDNVAKEAVQYLKEGKRGRAKFLPINLAEPRSFHGSELTSIASTKGISLALDSVKFDDTYRPIMQALLGRCLIADDLDIALKFVKSNKINAKISTLDGETVQMGSISGGQTQKQKANFFSKRRELEEVKNKFHKLEAELETQKKSIENLKSFIKASSTEINGLSYSFEEMKDTLQEKLALKDDAERQMAYFEEKIQELEVSMKDDKLTLSDVRKSLVSIQISIDTKQKEYNETNKNLEILTKKIKEVEEDFENSKEEKTNLTVEINRLQEEKKQLDEYLVDFSNDNGSLEDKIKKLHERRDSEILKINEYEEQKINLETQIIPLQSKLNDLNIKVEGLREDNKDLIEEIEGLEDEIKKIRVQKESKEKEKNSKEVYLSRKETELGNIVKRFLEAYTIEEEIIPTLERKKMDLTKSKKDIDEYKRRIKNLGSINHTAIEECERLEERYSKEKTQLSDVKTARADLMELLSTVEEEMKNRFVSTFNEVAKGFEKIFIEMFRGGKARVTLVDEKDPLNSAIEIIAQPPGKKPASINSLSGGEKAFTAVALIFAIITAKPSPFIILDEVDAPLDDANVGRFASQLSKYKEMSQFIVITHRKQCMAKCDSLLGITQEEQGVSIAFPQMLENIQSKTS